MNEPLVTVIVPTYERAHTLDRALTSIIVQTHRNLEVLVVDDHSTDGTRDLVLSYRSNDIRVHYLENEGPQGPSAARNAGLASTRGKYVAFLESDDEWHPEHVARSVAALAAASIDLVFSDVVRKRDGTTIKGLPRKEEMQGCALEPIQELERTYVVGNNRALLDFFIDCRPLVYLTTVVYDPRALPTRFNEAYCIAEDLAFYINLILDHDASFGFIDAAGTTKHMTEDSMSRWKRLDPKRYYSSQVDTYRFFMETVRPRLDAPQATRLAYQAAKRADILGGCYRADGDRQNARASYAEAFRLMPFAYPKAKFKLLAKVALA